MGNNRVKQTATTEGTTATTPTIEEQQRALIDEMLATATMTANALNENWQTLYNISQKWGNRELCLLLSSCDGNRYTSPFMDRVKAVMLSIAKQSGFNAVSPTMIEDTHNLLWRKIRKSQQWKYDIINLINRLLIAASLKQFINAKTLIGRLITYNDTDTKQPFAPNANAIVQWATETITIQTATENDE